MSAFSHIAQKRVKPVLAYSVDHVELIEPQEAVVLMIFWHFKILRSIFSCNFGPFLEGSKFFYILQKFNQNKILIVYNGSRVDRYMIVFCAILIRQMECIWNFLGNGMIFRIFVKKVCFLNLFKLKRYGVITHVLQSTFWAESNGAFEKIIYQLTFLVLPK